MPSAPPAPRGAPATAVDVLLRLAERAPDALVVTDAGVALTRSQLLAGAAAAALRLERALPEGTPPRAPVAVLAEAGADLVTALVAVLLAGRPAVLLDPQLPPGRLAAVQELCRAAAVLVDAGHAGAAADAAAGLAALPALVVSSGEQAGERDGAAVGRWRARRPPLQPGDAASVVVTSGSTGTPKGVVLSHAKVVDGALSAADLLGAADGSRVGAVAPPAFAMGQTAVLAALLSGASLHLHDPRAHGTRSLAAFLADHRVEATWVAPSLLRALSGPQGRPLPGLRRVVCGGEPLQGEDVLRARAALGAHLEVVNCLGSSETWHTAARVLLPSDPVPPGPVPPGDALPGVVLEVVDDDGAVLPDGATGVLRVRSAVLASGYLAGPQDAFSTLDGWACFTTADLARRGPDGALELRGRADDALKVRGYLVEPAEVERALRAQDGVSDAAVVVLRDGGAPRLVAYAAVCGLVRTPSAAHLRRRLREALPEWSVPEEVVLLAELPRTERGKVDRGALPVPRRAAGAPPQGAEEEAVAALWARVLGRDDVGRDDRFTVLGGDSLAVQELLVLLREHRGAALTASEVAEAATVRELAAVVAGARTGRRARHGSAVVLTPPERAPGRPVVLCFAGAGASGLSFLPLADALGPDQPAVALQPHGMEDGAAPDLSVTHAARRHLAAVRRTQPHGPYVLAGHSMGGLVALEVARLLRAAGEAVVSVTLVDTYAPRGPREVLTGGLLGRPPAAGDDAAPQPVPLPRRTVWRGRVGAVRALAGLRRGEHAARWMEDLGTRTSRLHRRRPWPGRALVFRSHLNPDGARAWDAVLLGEVVVRTLPADHGSVLREPHVAAVAAALAAEVDRAVELRPAGGRSVRPGA